MQANVPQPFEQVSEPETRRDDTPFEEISLGPEPSILIESLRDIGYSFNSALADILDNSITAGARNIRILALPIDDFRIAIVDDGEGLTRDELKRAMRLGSSDPRVDRQENDLGRFGLGLKTASFSQCRRLTVASRKDGKTHAFTWDLDVVVAKNDWTVLEHQSISAIPHIEELNDSGTLVLWENIDRLTGSNGQGKVDFNRVIDEAQDYLSLVFHRFLSGEAGLAHIDIFVNNRLLEPIDPFNVGNKATQKSPIEKVSQGVSIQSFTLPHRSQYERESDYERYALPGGYLKNQGIYLYRAKRLIIQGTWFGIAKKTALTQLCRVKIDIDINQDELWKIDVKKVSAQLPEEVRSRIKQLINMMGAPSKKVYRRRGTRLTSSEAYPAWNVIKTGEKTLYQINRGNPIIAAFRDSLDEGETKGFDMVLSLIEAAFPTESLFYEISNDSESVLFGDMSSETFAESARAFFASMKQAGKDDEEILSIMRAVDLFAKHWDQALIALGVKEQQ